MFVDNNDLIGKQLPEVALGGTWLNTGPRRQGPELRGRPVLVAFWTSTDLNSLHALAALNAWHERYGAKGLRIIGVHVPDFSFETRADGVARFLAAHHVTFPVLLDNDGRATDAFRCTFRPSFYLVDAQGVVRYLRLGEGEYFATERLIQAMLQEMGVPIVELPLAAPEGATTVCFHPSPRLYCGYARGRIGNRQENAESQATLYTDPGDRQEGHIYLQGVWVQEQECVRHARRTASPLDYLVVRYHALEVHVVMGSADEHPVQVRVSRDGAAPAPGVAGRDLIITGGEGWVTVAEPRLYALIADTAFGSHVLQLSTASECLEVYALAFSGWQQSQALGR